MKNSFLAGSALFLAMSGFAMAETPDFEKADVNADGVLSKVEADIAIPELSIPDVDRNGVVSKAEVKTVLPDVEFDADDEDPVEESDYEQLVQVYEEILESNS